MTTKIKIEGAQPPKSPSMHIAPTAPADPDFLHCNYFMLFGLPVSIELDIDALRAKYQQLQVATHPDRFIAAPASAQRLALEMTSRVNRGYQILQNPMLRAVYFLKLLGVTVFTDHPVMAPEFLMKIMDWKETLEAPVGKEQSAVLKEVEHARWRAATQTTEAIKKKNYAAAAASIQQWNYLEKLLTPQQEVDSEQ